MSFTRTIKQKSRRALKGTFVNAVIISVIAMLFEMLLTALEGFILALCDYFNLSETLSGYLGFLNPHTVIELIIALTCGIIWFFVISPLIIGEKRWYGNLILNRKLSVKEIFYFFTSPKRYFKSVWLSFLIFARLFLYATLLLIIPVTAFSFSHVLTETPSQITQNFGIVAFFLGCGFLSVAVILFVKIYFGFSIATHVFAMDERVTTSRAIKLSQMSVNKNESKLILFELSFFYYYILEFLIILLFFILPYYNCAHAVLAHELLENCPEITKNNLFE